MRITIDILCESCDHHWDSMMEREEATWEARFSCPECGSTEARRVMSAPAVKKVSYHDGYSRGDKYQIMKQVAKLKVDRASMSEGSRNDINREINTLTNVASKKKDKTE